MPSGSMVSSVLRDHVAKSRSVHTHPGKLLVLSRLLERLFGVKLEELIPGIETKLGSKLLGLRGSADLIFSDVVFEIKVDLKKELDDAETQLLKYLQVLHEREPERKHIGVATDAIKFVAYTPRSENDRVVGLKKVGSLNIAESLTSESVLWLDSFIFARPKITPSAMDLRWRFGPHTPTYSVTVDELGRLWDKVWNERDVTLKLDLWFRNTEIVYGDRPKVASFIEHTYLVTLVKLIVYLRLSEDKIVREEDLTRVLTGEYFASFGIANLIEEDFFAWILHPKIVTEVLRLVHGIAKQLLRYDLSQLDEDFFKEIYQEIVKRSERHRIGEYYTPEWLVQLALKEALGIWSERSRRYPKILDPACGSGTFLCNAIHLMRKELKTRGESEEEILRYILESIVGLDVNPLATVIARANYTIALGDLLQLGKPILLPIFTADSIQLPKVLTTLATGGKITVYEVDANGHPLQMPKSVVTRRGALSMIFDAFKDSTKAYKIRKDRNEALEIFKRRTALTGISGVDFDTLNSTLETILTLMDEGLNSIWIFMLNNIYAPVMLKESKFNIVIGNPPWIAMRYLENKSYQDFMKKQVLSYKLLESAQVHLFTQMETATLFFCRATDLYLENGGLIAFVMPRSVLTGALHHINFQQFRKPRMKLVKVFDLEDVSPLFNVPSTVLLAIKEGKTSYPVPASEFHGKLPEKNLRLEEAIEHLSIDEYMYEAPKIPTDYSSYYDSIKAGAAIYPRCLFFVEFERQPTLGTIDAKRPLVKSLKRKAEKEPWRAVRLEGNVEDCFIYASLLGGDLLPFGYTLLRPVVLPLQQLGNRFKLLDVSKLRAAGFVGMASWLNSVQAAWEQKRTEKAKKNFPRIIDAVDYQMLLTSQSPSKRFLVLYNSSGKNIVSCVIDKEHLEPFTVGRAKIEPASFVADKDTRLFETNDQLEAHYLCAFLNSNTVNEAIKPLQTRGLFGARHIHRRPFMLPIPSFDRDEPLHTRLAGLSTKCHREVASMHFAKKSVAANRKAARDSVKNEIAEIDEITSELL